MLCQDRPLLDPPGKRPGSRHPALGRTECRFPHVVAETRRGTPVSLKIFSSSGPADGNLFDLPAKAGRDNANHLPAYRRIPSHAFGVFFIVGVYAEISGGIRLNRPLPPALTD